jgi:carboxyl-terminal processing protease
MAASLDPHSGFVTGQDYRNMESTAKGEVGLVGVELVERESVPVVVEVTGVSAQRAGILPGDRIEAIDGEPTNGLTIDQANEKMRGPVNSSVSLAIAGDSGSATEQFKILS